MITGDDILIEYVSRVVAQLRLIDDDFHDEGELTSFVHESIGKFVSHQVWIKNKQDASAPPRKKLWAQMEQRMNEMLDRRRRLIKYTLKKERESIGSAEEINTDSAFKDLVNKKNSVVTRFSSMQLEDLLTSSTKNVAHEVVSCMIPKPGENGLLLILEGEV